LKLAPPAEIHHPVRNTAKSGKNKLRKNVEAFPFIQTLIYAIDHHMKVVGLNHKYRGNFVYTKKIS